MQIEYCYEASTNFSATFRRTTKIRAATATTWSINLNQKWILFDMNKLYQWEYWNLPFAVEPTVLRFTRSPSTLSVPSSKFTTRRAGRDPTSSSALPILVLQRNPESQLPAPLTTTEKQQGYRKDHHQQRLNPDCWWLTEPVVKKAICGISELIQSKAIGFGQYTGKAGQK